MKTIKNIKVPTGNILIVEGSQGKLEMLSLGDYGKDINIKCDALGLTREISRVEHTKLLPLSKKWVITISTQYGCSMGCSFCDVPSVGKGKNVTFEDLIKQVLTGIKLHPEITSSERLNIHFARMGEPTWNPNVLEATKWLKTHIDPEFKIHPVVSTMMPKNNEWLKTFIHTWMRIKNRLLQGEAGLQLSINSTDEALRETMFNGNACTLEQISKIMDGIVPNGRKITLNFAIYGNENVYEGHRYKGKVIDPKILLKYFNPDDYLVKLTPMHKTLAAEKNGIRTAGDYTQYLPYQETERQIKAAGYDVLVFIASKEEDLGRITCGNAILSGSLPCVPYKEIL